MLKSPRARVLLFCAAAIASLAALVWVLQKRSGHYEPKVIDVQEGHSSAAALANKVPATPLISITPRPGPAATSPPQELAASPSPLPSESPDKSLPPIGFIGTLKLIVPVAGVRPDQLQDTFKDARSEGRVHDAIDIPAPLGTPVFAAGDGEIIKLLQSERGGVTIYQLSADKKLFFYYAHLQRYEDGLYTGKYVRQGEVIGYVGDSGNAGPGNYHLHFAIAIIADPKRYWEGSNINPYPLLRK